MADLEPTGQRVFDPILGTERDAFPSEVVPLEQEKTLNRLMREGEERFLQIYNAVSGQLSEAESIAVLKAGRLFAEQKRQEYLEGIKSNPGNIIVNLLRPVANEATDQPVRRGLLFLNKTVVDLSNLITRLRSTDEVAGKPTKSISDYLRGTAADQKVFFYESTVPNQSVRIDIETDIFYEVISRLGALPSPNIQSYGELRNVVQGSRNEKESGKPFYFNDALSGTGISNLPCNIPGLEGFTVATAVRFINSGGDVRFQLAIFGDYDQQAALLENGQYTPFQAS